MIAIKESRADILQLQYEDVMVEEKMISFEAALFHRRLREDRKGEAHQIIWNNSPLGRLLTPTECDGRVSTHVLSGARSCVNKELPRAFGEIYACEFGDALIALVYERDHEWVSHLPLAPAPFNLQNVSEENPTYVQ